MARYKHVNGERVLMTPEEEAAREAEETQRMIDREVERVDGNRAQNYPPIGDQLDAILKQFNMMRLTGVDMNGDLDLIIGKWLQVKKDFPKL